MTDQVKNIDQMLQRLGDLADKNGKVLEAINHGRQGGAVSYFEHEDEDFGQELTGRMLRRSISNRQMQRLSRASARRRIPGYKRCGLDFRGFLKAGMADSESTPLKKFYNPSVETLARSLQVSTTDLEDGGFLVLPEYSNNLLELVYDDLNLWSRINEFNPGGNSMVFPKLNPDRTDGLRHGGFVGYWVGEKRKITESDANFETMTIKLGKLCVAIFVTEEMMDDNGFTLEQWITRHGSAEFSFQMGNALLNGIGGYQPIGLLNSTHRIVVPKESGQSNYTIVADNIVKMHTRRMAAEGGDDLVWLINQNCEAQLQKMYFSTGANSGQLVYTPPSGLAERPYATLQGLPVIPTEFNPALGEEGDIALVNFKHYIGLAKGGINQTASAHVEFLRDMNCIKLSMRVNGRPAYDKPITPFKSNGSDLQSSVVVLQSRAA